MNFFRVFLNNTIYEKNFCYAINPLEAVKIDPDPSLYFISRREERGKLDAGEYYIVQTENDLHKTGELLNLAIELQKEALWNRFKLNSELYLRSFSEDGSAVTQLWRPIIGNNLL